MTFQLTLGRTTFLVRREPAIRPSSAQQATPSFTAAWIQVFNGTWQAKAGACFPKQLSIEQDIAETEENNGHE